MTALAAGRASGRHSTARIEVLTTWAEFAGLADPWDELAQESQSGPFVSHRWLSAWFDSFGRAIAPRIVQIWRDGLLVAAAPVGISTESLSARLPFVEVPKLQMLSNHRTGYNEWLVAPGYDCEIPVLLDAVMRRTGTWSVAELEPFRRSTVFDRVVAAAREQNIRLLDDTTINSGFVDLSKGWEGYLAGRPREFRKNLRVAQRRLAATNHSILRAPSSETRTLERVLSLSARSWKGRAGTALGAREGTRTFIRRLWSTLGRTNAMDLYLLEIDGREAASFVSILERDTIYGFAEDIDEAFSKLSPGRSLLAHWLQDGAARGYRKADMLRWTPFIREFSDASYAMARLRLFPKAGPTYFWLLAEQRLRFLGRQWRARRRYQRKRRGAHKPAKGSHPDLAIAGKKPRRGPAIHAATSIDVARSKLATDGSDVT
jgi:CelD/BcsL family acetyltransferase involved in cellulose biosynthesis